MKLDLYECGSTNIVKNSSGEESIIFGNPAFNAKIAPVLSIGEIAILVADLQYLLADKPDPDCNCLRCQTRRVLCKKLDDRLVLNEYWD